MANDLNANVVRAADENLKLSIRGLVEVAVTLSRVLENNGRQPVPAGAATPSGNATAVNADDGLRAAMEGLSVEELVEDNRTARPRRMRPDNRRADRQNPSPNRAPPPAVPRANVGVNMVNAARVKGDRHYAVFSGKEVGVTQLWSKVKEWTWKVPGNSYRRFKTRAAAVFEFRDALIGGRVSIVDMSTPDAPRHIMINGDEWFDGCYDRLTRFAEADRRRGVDTNTTSTSTPSSVTESGTDPDSDDDDEDLYGYDDDPDFDELCILAVDAASAVNGA